MLTSAGSTELVQEPALATSVPAGLSEPTVTSAAGVATDGKEADEPSADGGRHARAALDLLSSLLGAGAADSAPFKLALFSGDDSAGGGVSSGDGSMIISFDAKDDARLQEMMTRLGLDDDTKKGHGGGKEDEEDDLLAMMDAAAKK